MTTNQTQPTPAQAPDAQPVTAVDPITMQPISPYAARLLTERDGYRQALETEKALRAADVRELRAALEKVVYCLSFHVEVANRGVGMDAECLRQGRAALQMARESRGAK